ncbi:hypothetical protein E4T47_02745 [Aureobasidium subglaciale]|nr:hypothetical protein E4T47_02745 [Aureobasidium subglaciale]
MVGTNVANISVSYVNIARIPFFGLEADLALDAFFILFILFFSPLFIYTKHWAAMNIALILCSYTLEATSSTAQRDSGNITFSQTNNSAIACPLDVHSVS